MKKKLTKKEQELQAQHDLCSQSVEFWYREIEAVFVQIEEEEERASPNEHKLKILFKKLEALIQKGDQEAEIIDKLDSEVQALVQSIRQKPTKNKPQKTVNKTKTVLCSKHPEYKAIRPPRANCFQCLAIWASNKGNK